MDRRPGQGSLLQVRLLLLYQIHSGCGELAVHLGDRQKSATEDTLMVCEQACSNCFHNGCTKVGHMSTCWCLRREHYLHAKNLREVAALHEQLLRQLAGGALLPAGALPRSPAALKPPSQKVLLVLQRAIAAGWADQVLASMCMLALISHLSTCVEREHMSNSLASLVMLQMLAQ